jgi:hypothetical protein
MPPSERPAVRQRSAGGQAGGHVLTERPVLEKRPTGHLLDGEQHLGPAVCDGPGPSDRDLAH